MEAMEALVVPILAANGGTAVLFLYLTTHLFGQ